MEHVVRLKGRRIADIDSREGDLPGHIVTQYSQNSDTLRVIFDDRHWRGYDSYSVIFWRPDIDTFPHKEYSVDYENATVPIPGSMTMEPGTIQFAIKALSADTGKRLLSADDNTRLQITTSGVIDGCMGNEDKLTDLEATLEEAKKLLPSLEELQDLYDRVEQAIERAESIGALDYAKAINKPAITEHILESGENTLEDIGITSCTQEEILALVEGWK